jgi:hypothetical protein
MKARDFSGEAELCALLEELNASYYFGGDFHGYVRRTKDQTAYVTSGGGGANLEEVGPFAFHHALVVTVHGTEFVEQLCVVPKQFSLLHRPTYLALHALAAGPWFAFAVPGVIAAALAAALLVTYRVHDGGSSR